LKFEEIKQRVLAFEEETHRPPGLAVILTGTHLASEVYVRRKIEACREVGIRSFFYPLAADVSALVLDQVIHQLNQNREVDGILLQLPLPPHLDPNKAVSAILPQKDVDGLHPYNQGLLYQSKPLLSPCTPQGCVQLLESCCEVAGACVVIIGRSILVGRPLAAMLTNLNATVTLAHSQTKNLDQICRQADILVSAVGKPQFITTSYIKQGAIVVDVGINRLREEGNKNKIVGDVDFESVAHKTSFITPVPGGVGPMTIANLLLNTVKAAELMLNFHKLRF
jgi:methylenetetrahydrofolate dehydrogenase (NADP+)/methenyltetrahydrofolate cyclohydrolase